MVSESIMHVRSMVEKPKPSEAPSNLSIVGRYILPARIHSILATTPRGRGGEFQLTDALAVLAREGSAWGVKFEGKRFDTGNFLGLLDATLHYAGKRPQLVDGLQELLAKYTLNTSNK
jgi:UTP--glucose-1-phosphate uridylyltransferase